MDLRQFEDRKRDHLRFAMNSAHQASGLGGLERIHLVHEALPDLNLSEIDLSAPCLGRMLRTPFYVSGMTAGHEQAVELNSRLARVCSDRGWAFGVGSQRRELTSETPDRWKEFRARFPELTVFANIGITQLVDVPIAKLSSLCEALGAQALVVHANALQEAIQPEGTPNFRGSRDALKRVSAELGRPVILKETGCGFSPVTLQWIAGAGLAALDVSGLGGTHWGRIEGARASGARAEAAQTFADWGEPTAECVSNAAKILPKKVEIWASGGVRSGLDAAKLIALGAHRVGYAKPALEKALAGSEALAQWMELQEFELRTALFCTGSLSPEGLRQKEGVLRT